MTDEQKKIRNEVVNETIEAAKNKFDEIVIVGIKNGVVDVVPSIATYQFCQWLLDRAKFELLISEKSQIVSENTGQTTETEK